MKPRKTDFRRARVALFATVACGATLLLGAAAARAGTIASGFLWSENADRMACFVWNVSDSPVTITERRIVNDDGVNLLVFGGCNGVLQPGARCGFLAYDVTQAGGRVTIDAPRNRVRGACHLLTTSLATVASGDMR